MAIRPHFQELRFSESLCGAISVLAAIFLVGVLAYVGQLLWPGAFTNPHGGSAYAKPNERNTSHDAVLIADPMLFCFGVIAAGAKREAEIKIFNPTNEDIALANIETSCPCFKIHLTEYQVKAHQYTTVRAVLDLQEEAAFRGRLRLEGSSRSGVSRLLFAIVATVEVVEPVLIDR